MTQCKTTWKKYFSDSGTLEKKIFDNLDIQSLKNCSEFRQSWKDFIHREKLLSFQIIKFYSSLPDASIRKILSKSDSNQAAELANNVTLVYKKIPFNNSDTPLHFAAECGFSEICEMIMENMEEKNPQNNSWVTPLHEAASEGHLEVCKLICTWECAGKKSKKFLSLYPFTHGCYEWSPSSLQVDHWNHLSKSYAS